MDHAVIHADALELVELADVDENLRRRQPQVQRRNETLAAGERNCRSRMCGKEIKRVFEARRFYICEVRRFHCASLCSSHGVITRWSYTIVPICKLLTRKNAIR